MLILETHNKNARQLFDVATALLDPNGSNWLVDYSALREEY